MIVSAGPEPSSRGARGKTVPWPAASELARERKPDDVSTERAARSAARADGGHRRDERRGRGQSRSCPRSARDERLRPAADRFAVKTAKAIERTKARPRGEPEAAQRGRVGRDPSASGRSWNGAATPGQWAERSSRWRGRRGRTRSASTWGSSRAALEEQPGERQVLRVASIGCLNLPSAIWSPTVDGQARIAVPTPQRMRRARRDRQQVIGRRAHGRKSAKTAPRQRPGPAIGPLPTRNCVAGIRLCEPSATRPRLRAQGKGDARTARRRQVGRRWEEHVFQEIVGPELAMVVTSGSSGRPPFSGLGRRPPLTSGFKIAVRRPYGKRRNLKRRRRRKLGASTSTRRSRTARSSAPSSAGYTIVTRTTPADLAATTPDATRPPRLEDPGPGPERSTTRRPGPAGRRDADPTQARSSHGRSRSPLPCGLPPAPGDDDPRGKFQYPRDHDQQAGQGLTSAGFLRKKGARRTRAGQGSG